MNLNLNYYSILKVTKHSEISIIKKSYYELSKKLHPDINKDISLSEFQLISEAWSVLNDEEQKLEYDLKSKWGKNYDEYYELFEIDTDFNYDESKQKLEDFKKNSINNIQIEVDDTFDGNLEYERFIKCKSCDGTGKDMCSKIVIRDINGNIVKIFDAEDGCDFCEGTGKDPMGEVCSFCNGKGKIGVNPCKVCNGEKRILGKQKLTKIKLSDEEKTKIDLMGHYSKDGKIGYLLLKRKVYINRL